MKEFYERLYIKKNKQNNSKHEKLCKIKIRCFETQITKYLELTNIMNQDKHCNCSMKS